MRNLNCPVKDCMNKVLVSEADIAEYDQGKIACSEHQLSPKRIEMNINAGLKPHTQ